MPAMVISTEHERRPAEVFGEVNKSGRGLRRGE
jgi:hypothetical protein